MRFVFETMYANSDNIPYALLGLAFPYIVVLFLLLLLLMSVCQK